MFFLCGRQSLRYGLLEVALGEVFGDGHLRGSGGGRPVAVIVVEGIGGGDIDILVHIRVFVVGVPGPVRGFVVIHHKEGFFFIAFF